MKDIIQQKFNSMVYSQLKSGTTNLIISLRGENYQQSNNTRHVVVAICVIMVMSLFSISNLKAQSLEDYQREAAQNNPELYALFLNYNSELEQRTITGTLPDTEVAFAYFINPDNTMPGSQKASISVTQMFPWFGSLADKRAISTAMARMKFEEFQERRNRLFFQMEELWGELYVVERNIESVEANLSIINNLLNLSFQQYENGLTSQVDVLRAQIEQEDLKTALALLQDNKNLLIQEFNELRNIDPNTKVEAPTELKESENIPEFGIDQIYQNPRLSMLRYTKDASATAIDLAKKDGRPEFGVGLDYMASGTFSDIATFSNNAQDELIARASIRIPLFRNKYRAKVRQAKWNLNAVQQDITTLENQLETSYLTALKDKKDAQRRFELYNNTQIQRIEQAVRILIDSYSTDNVGFEEVLRLQRKLLDYQLKRDQARADEFIALSYIGYLYGVNNITPNEINY